MKQLLPPTIHPWPRQGFAQLLDDREYDVVAEVGVDKGEFSWYLLEYSWIDKLYCVDPWPGERGERSYRHAAGLLDDSDRRVELLRMTSIEAARWFAARNQQLDFVYIDANHSRRSVEQDIAAWWPLVRPGGCLAGHDYIEIDRCGVVAAVNSFCIAQRLQLNLTNEAEWRSWFVFKS